MPPSLPKVPSSLLASIGSYCKGHIDGLGIMHSPCSCQADGAESLSGLVVSCMFILFSGIMSVCLPKYSFCEEHF